MTDLRQLHFRFRTDAGTADALPTWGAGEDVNYYPGTANFRLRIGLRNASTVVAATPWELYVSRNGDAYTPVTTTIAKGVQSVDAGSSADDTAVLIPRLYPFSPDWELSDAAIDLDFAGSRIYPGGQFTDYLSITRASTGYAKTVGGVLTSFSTNQLRLTDLGLLTEDARTNIALQSQTFGSLNLQAVTVTADAVVAPDGTTTADTLVETALSGVHNAYSGPTTITSGATLSFSVYAKASGRNFCYLNFQNGVGIYFTAVYDLVNGTVSETSVGGTAGTITSTSIEALANGWYRCVLVGNIGANTTGYFVAGAATVATGNIFTGAGEVTYVGTASLSAVTFWGLQCEEGAYPTSYIPTVGAAATRALDNIVAIGSLSTILAAVTRSIVADCKTLASNATQGGIVGNSAGTGNEFLVGSVETSVTAQVPTGDSATLGGSLTFSGGVKVGIALDSSGHSLVGGGGAVTTNAETLQIATHNIGLVNSTFAMNGYLRRITVWNTRLDDATLDALTAP